MTDYNDENSFEFGKDLAIPIYVLMSDMDDDYTRGPLIQSQVEHTFYANAVTWKNESLTKDKLMSDHRLQIGLSSVGLHLFVNAESINPHMNLLQNLVSHLVNLNLNTLWRGCKVHKFKDEMDFWEKLQLVSKIFKGKNNISSKRITLPFSQIEVQRKENSPFDIVLVSSHLLATPLPVIVFKSTLDLNESNDTRHLNLFKRFMFDIIAHVCVSQSMDSKQDFDTAAQNLFSEALGKKRFFDKDETEKGKDEKKIQKYRVETSKYFLNHFCDTLVAHDFETTSKKSPKKSSKRVFLYKSNVFLTYDFDKLVKRVCKELQLGIVKDGWNYPRLRNVLKVSLNELVVSIYSTKQMIIEQLKTRNKILLLFYAYISDPANVGFLVAGQNNNHANNISSMESMMRVIDGAITYCKVRGGYAPIKFSTHDYFVETVGSWLSLPLGWIRISATKIKQEMKFAIYASSRAVQLMCYSAAILNGVVFLVKNSSCKEEIAQNIAEYAAKYADLPGVRQISDLIFTSQNPRDIINEILKECATLTSNDKDFATLAENLKLMTEEVVESAAYTVVKICQSLIESSIEVVNKGVNKGVELAPFVISEVIAEQRTIATAIATNSLVMWSSPLILTTLATTLSMITWRSLKT
jgi:uncharacterized protein (DUF486 family)